jgi:hypothetical protein
MAFDELSRGEFPLASKPDRELVQESRWVLLKNPANHTDRQTIK